MDRIFRLRVTFVIEGDCGVANVGNDTNWTGHPMAQANWYAFGRLAWNPQLSSEEIIDEWMPMTLNYPENTPKEVIDGLKR